MFNVTFQQIEAFLNLAKYSNLCKAAEAMFISQPALSKTLQRFEEGIHLQLFTRSHQGLTLTHEGEYLYSTLELLYNNMNKAFTTAQSLSTPSKILSIVAPSSFDASANFDRLKSFVELYEKRYPDVLLIESLCDFKELRQKLEFGEIDLAFTQEFSVRDMQNISFLRVSKFELFLAMSASHPLAAREKLDLNALSNECFYCVPSTKNSADTVYSQCHKIGFTPKAVEFAANFPTLLHDIRQGKGMGIVGKFNYLYSEDIKYFQLPDSLDSSYVVVAWQPERLSSEARNFISLLAESDDNIVE